jgi:hypothetical protein
VIPTNTNLLLGEVGVVRVSMKTTSSELNHVSKGTSSMRWVGGDETEWVGGDEIETGSSRDEKKESREDPLRGYYRR